MYCYLLLLIVIHCYSLIFIVIYCYSLLFIVIYCYLLIILDISGYLLLFTVTCVYIHNVLRATNLQGLPVQVKGAQNHLHCHLKAMLACGDCVKKNFSGRLLHRLTTHPASLKKAIQLFDDYC